MSYLMEEARAKMKGLDINERENPAMKIVGFLSFWKYPRKPIFFAQQHFWENAPENLLPETNGKAGHGEEYRLETYAAKKSWEAGLEAARLCICHDVAYGEKTSLRTLRPFKQEEVFEAVKIMMLYHRRQPEDGKVSFESLGFYPIQITMYIQIVYDNRRCNSRQFWLGNGSMGYGQVWVIKLYRGCCFVRRTYTLGNTI